MKTLIFRTIAPFLAALMVLFSVFVTLRGHNEPGGGFIGGLIAVLPLASIQFGAHSTSVLCLWRLSDFCWQGCQVFCQSCFKCHS